MFAFRTLQAKLQISVFLITALTIGCVTVLVIYGGRHQFQAGELQRIFYTTDAMTVRLGHLIYGKNWRYLMMTLNNAKSADPTMQSFAVTDTGGTVIIADDTRLLGVTAGTVFKADDEHPLYSRQGTQTRGRFRIFLTGSNPAGANKDDKIFTAVYDIVYLGKNMGQLRVGFSRAKVKKQIQVLVLALLGMGCVVLFVVMGIIYLVIGRHMAPVQAFSRRISSLDFKGDGRALRRALTHIRLSDRAGETRDVRLLKQAFNHMRDQFVRSWDQLENHRDNLEQMVTERTIALNQANERLNRQIEERKEIESRVLTVQKLEAIGTLAGGVAHEFNNLFMAISGYAALIQKRCEPGHPNIEKAERIRCLVEEGAWSVQQLLGFARVGKYAPGPLNLNEIVRLSLLMLGTSKKSVKINAHYERRLWTVQADRSQMEQVAMNLLLNAAEVMENSGVIHVTTRNVTLEKFQVSLDKQVSGRYVMLIVRDEGPGIDPDILPRIFDPFFTTKILGQGSGLGLASVFGILENHAGFITAESEKGTGSTFRAYVPAIDEGAQFE